jgi:hypothetical protein
MNGTLVLNTTIGGFLEPESLTEPIEESIKNWTNRVNIFEALKVIPQRTEERGKTVSTTSIFVKDSVEENGPYSDISQIIQKKNLAEKFPKASQRIQMFKGLKENWDGDQGLPPSLETLEHAYEILNNLYGAARVRKTRAPEPRVTCGGDGEITFAWTLGKTELELGFCVDGGVPRYDYLVCSASDEGSCEEGVFEGDLVNSPTFVALFSVL